MKAEQLGATASLLKQTAFTLRKLAELEVGQPMVQPECSTEVEYTVDFDELRKIAHEG